MEAQSTNSENKPIVLLVDDDEEDRMLMRMALNSMEMAAPVREFDSGEKLLRFLQQETTGHSNSAVNSWIVILDKYMPGMSGFDTLREIKENPDWQRIPVVLFVNTQNEGEMELCIDLGATVCISKPLYFEEIKELMRQVYQHWLDSASSAGNLSIQ
ncbi:response regulator [Larkinella rosea]|uniref:Response regulator n=1 Tax=Larkinella rosea TaxID=2025312 RepID=A0A3P1BU79_9BACT|nr:response regulator [Larkinella rosea]RRB04479.1 response regulator [Larkinella rosea]